MKLLRGTPFDRKLESNTKQIGWYIALNNSMTNCCKYTYLSNFIALIEFVSRKINVKFKTSLLSSLSFSLSFFYPPNNISSRIDHQCHPKIFNPHQCRYILRDVIWKRTTERERERKKSFIDQTKSTRNNGMMNVSLTCQSRRLLPRSNGCHASILDSSVRCSLPVSFREIFANIFQATIMI